MRIKRVRLISPSCRGLHRGQRLCAVSKGRTYDRTNPNCKSTEKALAMRAVPHMTRYTRSLIPLVSFSLKTSRIRRISNRFVGIRVPPISGENS